MMFDSEDLVVENVVGILLKKKLKNILFFLFDD